MINDEIVSLVVLLVVQFIIYFIVLLIIVMWVARVGLLELTVSVNMNRFNYASSWVIVHVEVCFSTDRLFYCILLFECYITIG